MDECSVANAVVEDETEVTMSRQPSRGAWTRSLTIGLLGVILLILPVDAAEPDAQDALIQAQIAAGEFAPALAMARRAAAREKRDAWLAQIAAAQARAGARDASLRTAAEISDDRVRADALSRVAAEPLGGRGGGAGADFDSLIDLITSTIQPTTWDDVGGPGSIAPFPTGVYVDPQGVLRPLLKQEDTGDLAALHASSAARVHRDNVRQSSPLRKVSLPRLEKQVQLHLAAGHRPTEAMQVLAGLERIEYVFVYPDSGDIVLAGPAGNWHADREDRIVSTQSGRPVLRLDDLVVVLRHMTSTPDARFGCLIKPRQEALARLQAFLEESSKTTIRPGGRKAWLEQLRLCLGEQDIEVYGLDPRTRAAQVMVEADYRMKLVGMGLEEGVPGVESYLELLVMNVMNIRPREAPPPMGVLRWWFTLNYEAVLATEDRCGFAVRGQGVKVLSENELLTAEGKRIHTGKSEELNRQFAQSFTDHFEALCDKYPVYAELRNICDLALVAALIRQEDLAGKTGWHMTCFGDPGAYQVETSPAPKTVETVINHRVIRAGDKIHTLAGVSGGVRVDPSRLVARGAIEVERHGALGYQQSAAVPKELPPDAWWWD